MRPRIRRFSQGLRSDNEDAMTLEKLSEGIRQF